jgi:hypothetical protein
MLYLASSTAPDAATIKAQGPAIGKGTAIGLAGGTYGNTFSGLTPNTEYTLYYVAENANGFSNVASVTFTTLIALPVLSFTAAAPTLTGTYMAKSHTLDVVSNLYGVIYLRGVTAPTALAIQAHSDANVKAYISLPNYPSGTGSSGFAGLIATTDYTLWMVAENAGGFSPVISYDFSTTTLSSNAKIQMIGGVSSITFGVEVGTIATPITASINASNAYSSIGIGQVSAANGASRTVYRDAAFTDGGIVSLTVGVPTHVYIKVVAEDGTTLYYDVTVTRSA